jgi:RNA polymerase sigma-70 factor (ECF subfamily)
MTVDTADRPDRRRTNDPFLEGAMALIPSLRAYALMLSGSSATADDLVQETLLKAIRFRSGFSQGSNLRAWLFTILRNHFMTQARRGARTREDIDGVLTARMSTPASQEWTVRYSEVLKALQKLSPEQREVLTLLGAGSPYEEIAEIAGCPLGTVKSRVNRARAALLEILEKEEGGGALPATRARALRGRRQPTTAPRRAVPETTQMAASVA